MDFSRLIILLALPAVANAAFFCSPIWYTSADITESHLNGTVLYVQTRGTRTRYRVSAQGPADVAALNARFAHLPNGGCHTNCNSTESRFIFFRYSNRSFPFVMDGTCPRSVNRTLGANDYVYHLRDLDTMVGNGADFRCGHHRGIGHDAGYYSFVLENCVSKIGFLNTFVSGSVAPTSQAPTSAPTTMAPTYAPSVSPTNQPTTAPTAAPTNHPCNVNDAGCDTTTTQCVIMPNAQHVCACLPGYFRPSGGSATSCQSPQPTLAPTAAPTAVPTSTPTTAAPTMWPTTPDPCSDGTHQCDPTSATCATYTIAPYYTCLCNLGYESPSNVDPWNIRSCVVATTTSPDTSASTSDSSMGSTGIAVIIAVIVIAVVIIAAVWYTQKSNSAPAERKNFDNPMYADTDDATAAQGESHTDEDGYMDVDADTN